MAKLETKIRNLSKSLRRSATFHLDHTLSKYGRKDLITTRDSIIILIRRINDTADKLDKILEEETNG